MTELPNNLYIFDSKNFSIFCPQINTYNFQKHGKLNDNNRRK